MDVVVTDLNAKGIYTITLNCPKKLNVLTDEVLDNLYRQFEHAKYTSAIKAVLLTGVGKAFCAGADIHRLAEVNTQTGYQFACEGQAIFRSLETLGKPSLAAINGFAFGGGCELAMAASLRIANTQAQFGQPEVKLGVIPGYGGTQRLARLVGKGRALDLCLTGRFISSQEALNFGLVSEVVPESALIARAEAILEGILNQAPLAVRSILEVIDRGYDLPLDDALHLEAVHFGLVAATLDKQEGVNAFLQKRPPVFRGE